MIWQHKTISVHTECPNNMAGNLAANVNVSRTDDVNLIFNGSSRLNILPMNEIPQ